MIFIFDIDGTLADNSHRVHYILKADKDWDAYHQACDCDTPILPTIAVLNCLYKQDHKILFWTGRDEIVRKQTEEWIETWTAVKPADIRYNLSMRGTGDHREDHKLKERALMALGPISRAKLAGVFEDREQVVAMWRRNGVMCFQVAEGKY